MAGPADNGSGGGSSGSKGNNGGQMSTTSWENGGALNTNALSADKLNSALRSDLGALYGRGPVQTQYAGMSDATKQAMGGLQSTAQQGLGWLLPAANYQLGQIGSGGLTDNQRGSIDYMKTVMDGTGTAPGYDTLRANAIDDARTAVNRQFGASGRFGAGSHVQDLGRGITDAAAGLDYRNYEADLARKAAAAQGIFSMEQYGQGNAASAAAQLPGLYEGLLTPSRLAVQSNTAIDQDNAARAAFDPNLQHLATYQGLLGGNAQAPQPAKQPGLLDFMGLIGGLGAALL